MSRKAQTRIHNRHSGRNKGFTLIELLVVIGIIAILAALIFPVFNAVRENAREATTMSNLHTISNALALYKLDNHRYPDVLFAYACNGQEDSVATQQAGNQLRTCNEDQNGNPLGYQITMGNVANIPNNHDLLVGLYPEYVKDWQTFTCPNNVITDASAITMSQGSTPAPVQLDVNVVCPKNNTAGGDYMDAGNSGAAGGTPCDKTVNPPPTGFTNGGYLAKAKQYFFTADAMDISPQLSGNNQLAGGSNFSSSTYTYLPRYQTSWMSYPSTDATNPTHTNASDADYIRQLRWQNPPANTYVTSLTYHVPYANNLILLYESGSASVQKIRAASGWFGFNTMNPPLPITPDNGHEPTDTNYIDSVDAQGNALASIGTASAGLNSPAVFWRYANGNQ